MNEIGFATLRVELYGHGKSGGVFEQHNLMKWINNAMTVTDYAKTLDFVTDLYICGHSQGGLLTMLAAGMRADDFKAAIPMSPAIVIPDGARKGNLTFFGNRSLNRGFHSLYEVEEEKSFERMSQNRVKRTVLCERRKTFFNLYSKTLFMSSVGARKKKLYFIS